MRAVAEEMDYSKFVPKQPKYLLVSWLIQTDMGAREVLDIYVKTVREW